MRHTVKKDVDIIVCDVCGYQQTTGLSLMDVCVACGREYCMTCAGHGTNPFSVPICKDCKDDPKVEELMDAALPRYRKERDTLVGHLKELKITKKTRDREKEWEGEVRP